MKIVVAIFGNVIAVAPADNIRADNAIIGAELAGKIVKVAGVSGQAVDAEQCFLMLELLGAI